MEYIFQKKMSKLIPIKMKNILYNTNKIHAIGY